MIKKKKKAKTANNPMTHCVHLSAGTNAGEWVHACKRDFMRSCLHECMHASANSCDRACMKACMHASMASLTCEGASRLFIFLLHFAQSPAVDG